MTRSDLPIAALLLIAVVLTVAGAWQTAGPWAAAVVVGVWCAVLAVVAANAEAD